MPSFDVTGSKGDNKTLNVIAPCLLKSEMWPGVSLNAIALKVQIDSIQEYFYLVITINPPFSSRICRVFHRLKEYQAWITQS